MNSENKELPTSISTPTNEPSPGALSPYLAAEAPLLAQTKSLTEMTDGELQTWHARLRQHRASYPTLASYLSDKPEKEKKESKTKVEEKRLLDVYQ